MTKYTPKKRTQYRQKDLGKEKRKILADKIRDLNSRVLDLAAHISTIETFLWEKTRDREAEDQYHSAGEEE